MDLIDIRKPPVPPVAHNPDDIVKKWLEKQQQGLLSNSTFRDYWRYWVPKIYSPPANESCLNWCFNEDEATRILFNTLEQFICNDQPADSVLSKFTQLDQPPSVCGHVFKLGEPTYSCRECGTDNTCVLCVDCFKKSEHRFHKYKMGTSSGGGCCDCGDNEAWKKAPSCDIHLLGSQLNENEHKLPDDMIERTHIIFQTVLWYAHSQLTAEHTIDLKADDPDDDMLQTEQTFCTILFNDEVHTFEQVISVLARTIKCEHRTSIEYVTNIDRDGRAIIKCSNVQNCQELKREITKQSTRNVKPLKVLVVHSNIVAHQFFSMRLLTWLKSFLGHGEKFRAIFAEELLKNTCDNISIAKSIMMCDSHLWKSARTHWHRLFISGMLLEYENKKSLAKVFTKNYGLIMKDFIKDDHDHSFSISSLAVQLFTVPTLAYHLIEQDEVLFILLNTFNSECAHKCNKSGRLEFERNSTNHSFQRAQYMLYDLRYLLGIVPQIWTDQLRKNFLHGLQHFLKLLNMMQGMDSVTRQVGQHMEFEPEWKSAFNLHIKLSYSISLAIKWCGSDKVVLIKAYRMVVAKLLENPCYGVSEPGELRELVDHSVNCLSYDVSTKPVSIHIPLTRFLAGLHLYLDKYDLTFDSTELAVNKPTPVQIMEPALRAQVMISQVHSGMWRRNGYALLNQLYFYHDVKCRTEMLDRDINVLQIGAALIENNEFLIHVLNKFNLMNWIAKDFEMKHLKNASEDENVRQIVNLVEEFLQLLVMIVGERYIPGISDVTHEDRIRKEIIQQLCIKPLPHSELTKCIPDDLANNEIDEVIEQLAVFKKPSTGGKGVYELKPEYLKDYNVFYYHYTREELSKSEETQRLNSKAAVQLDCCPPPKLPKVKESFNLIVNLLQCDVMLHIMHTVLSRSFNLRARSFSEVQLHKVLHLIGYALHEEESAEYPFLVFTQRATKWEIPALLGQLVGSERVKTHRDLIRWTINKFKQIAATPASQPTDDMESKEQLEVDKEKERRARLGAQRRARVLEQMKAAQNNFIKENSALFEDSTSTAVGEQLGRSVPGTSDDTEMMDIGYEPVAIGPKQSACITTLQTYTCILCQEEQVVSRDSVNCLVMAAFVHQATVLCQHRTNEQLMDVNQHEALFLNANLGPAPHTNTCGHVMHVDCWRKYYNNVQTKERKRLYRHRHPISFNIDRKEFLCPLCECLSNTVLPILPPLNIVQPAVPTDSVHFQLLFDDFIAQLVDLAVNKKKTVQAQKAAAAARNDMEEYEGLDQDASSPKKEEDSTDPINFDAQAFEDMWFEMEITAMPLKQSTYNSSGQMSLFEITDSSLSTDNDHTQFNSIFPTGTASLSPQIQYVMQLFACVTYATGLNTKWDIRDHRLVAMTWKTCAYTIHAIETVLRDGNRPLLGSLSSRHRDCLENLVRTAAALGATNYTCPLIVSHGTQLLSMLFGIDADLEGPSILQWDSFGFLVSLTMTLSSLTTAADSHHSVAIPAGGTLDGHVMHLLTIAHIVKIVILSDFEHMVDDDEPMSFSSNNDNEQGYVALTYIISCTGKPMPEKFSYSRFWEHIQIACSPFLRCCVLFYHYLTDVPAPLGLTIPHSDTFAAMCTYLGLSDQSDSLLASSSEQVKKLIQCWCEHTEVCSYLKGENVPVVREPLPINRLMSLPSDYSELINTVSSFTCPNSEHEDSRNPTMCLVCGEILCSQSYCCQSEINGVVVGACNQHAHGCGAGVGVFLRVRECEIMYLSAPYHGCFVSPPYLDDYGETDQGLRRGNPLRLCPARYQQLQQQWLGHTIQEEIARSIETSNNIVPTNWQHL